MSAHTNKDVMPAFTPPESSEANGWHCWHPSKTVAYSNGRVYVCCYCGGGAHFAFMRHTTLQPVNHGPHYPVEILETGEWSFSIDGDTPYICDAGKKAAEVK